MPAVIGVCLGKHCFYNSFEQTPDALNVGERPSNSKATKHCAKSIMVAEFCTST